MISLINSSGLETARQSKKNSLYSLDNNITVVQILEAARESLKSGKTIFLNK
jgi:predicted RNA binding protein with dsRBD fold (UPF0201 family)